MLQNLVSQYNQMYEAYEELKTLCSVVISYSIADYLEFSAIAQDALVKMCYIKSLIAHVDFYTFIHLKA
jgi:hypothetical protein